MPVNIGFSYSISILYVLKCGVILRSAKAKVKTDYERFTYERYILTKKFMHSVGCFIQM